jgi:hypothetical protein
MPMGARVLPVFGVCALELVMIFVVAQSPTDPVAWAFLLGITIVAVVNVMITRRSCVIENGQLIAKGRFATRRVDLSDLRQVALSYGFNVWIQTHHPLDKRGGDVLLLRMIPISKFTLESGPTSDNAVTVIRNLAEAAGTQLDPPLAKPTRAPSRKALIFSI